MTINARRRRTDPSISWSGFSIGESLPDGLDDGFESQFAVSEFE